MKGTDKQQRETKQRRLVYDAVMSRCDHPNADEIYADVHSRDEKISRATVYRNLKLLSENGEITHVRVPGADRFDKTLESHYHIICTNCGKVIDSPIKYISENDDIVEKAVGFKIKRHRTVFEGVCGECRGKEALL